ncbi:hypothetical protein C8J57DRAFT_750298 [Mycena rebaudengoi]|nr:hypothetical protein C8J57DRAFT_750298 [Mycena rebaudengoi]
MTPNGQPASKKATDGKGVPLRGPVTVEHLRVRARLDLTRHRDAALWVAALAAFWSCHRLGELLIKSTNQSISRSTTDGRQVLNFHLVLASPAATAYSDMG